MNQGATWYGLSPEDLTPQAQRLWTIATHGERVVQWAEKVACIFLVALAILTMGLVMAKTGFTWVNNALEELKWVLCAGIFLLGGTHCLRVNGHVRVDTLYGRFPLRVQALIDCIGLAVALLPGMAIIVWFGATATWESYLAAERSVNGDGLPVLWPVWALLPTAGVLLVWQALCCGLRSLAVLLWGKGSNHG